jgi:hypothetical protein
MALKILSGMVFIKHGGSKSGNAVISFDPFELSDRSSRSIVLRKVRQIGPDGRYQGRPAVVVAARQFAMTFPLPHASSYRPRLGHTVTRDFLDISWSVSSNEGRVDQEEIPFMVIGQVPDVRKGARRISRRRGRRTTRRRSR